MGNLAIDLQQHAVTSAERRVAGAIAMEPGGPPTAQAKMAGAMIRAVVKSMWALTPTTPRGFLTMRRFDDSLGALAVLPRGVDITPEDFGAFGAEWVDVGRPGSRPRDPASGKVVLYFHGGGYFFGSAKLYRPLTWRLAAASGRPVLAVDYRLAPEHTPAESLEDALTAYRSLLERGYAADRIVLAGDSAGGHLTLATLLALAERGLPAPRAAICLSPWADMECTAESHTLNQRTDALVPARKLVAVGQRFCAGKERTDPLFSPVSGDYKGLPPLMLISSGSEILRDDARTVAARARAAGVEVVHHEWAGLVHVFPLFAEWIPEGRAAFRHIAEFLREVESRPAG